MESTYFKLSFLLLLMIIQGCSELQVNNVGGVMHIREIQYLRLRLIL